MYQKAYVEFFTSPAKLDALLERGKGAPTVSLLAVNAAGDVKSFGPGTTEETGGINAVTWGVFPGREVVQPTVVDVRSFLVWKDEAFGAWSEEWAPLYAEVADDTSSKDVLEKVGHKRVQYTSIQHSSVQTQFRGLSLCFSLTFPVCAPRHWRSCALIYCHTLQLCARGDSRRCRGLPDRCLLPSSCGAVVQIKSSYYLVSIVENDFVHGDLFTLLEGL